MQKRLQQALPDILIVAFLFLVPLIFFFPQTIGGRTLLPVDNLFAFEPYASLADEYGVGTPHNGLISDLILENYVWKQFAREQITQGEIPLWQPYIVGGAPFLAAGQSSMLYPFSLLFLIMPLSAAYGWFTVSQLWLAAVNMYIFARVLGIRRPGSLIAGLVYQLSGFFMVSVVFPMIIATAVWLPLELAMIELTIRQGKALGGQPATIPWMAVGAIGLGMATLAGHVEALYFTLLVMAFYAVWRLIAGLIAAWNEQGKWGKLLRRSLWLLLLVGAGLALGAVQLVPAYELASRSFREGAASLAQVRDWAYPTRRVLAFLMPNFFGNPAHHTYFDVFTWQRVPITVNALGDPINNTHWGIKNYVEGGTYLGLLPMVLALIAALHWIIFQIIRRGVSGDAGISTAPTLGFENRGRPYRLIFGVLSILSVSFIFGTPTYAILYYGLPFINQSHSPFRWVWPLTLSVAVLAGFGIEILMPGKNNDAEEGQPSRRFDLPRLFGWGTIAAGALTLLGLIASRLFYSSIDGLVQRTFEGLALAPNAFPDGRAFYSYQVQNALIFALMALMAGGVLILSCTERFINLPDRLRHAFPRFENKLPIWLLLAPIVVIVDLGVAIYGFYPATDPALLRVVIPSINHLQALTTMGRSADIPPSDYSPYLWRFIAYEEPGADTMNSNIGWLHRLQDASGYDSLIPGQYADYMRIIQPQDDLPYNRIAPLYSSHPDALDSPLLDLLNVKYVITETPIDNPKYELSWQDDSVLIYENLGVMPRAFTLPVSSTVISAADDRAVGFTALAAQYDYRRHVIVNIQDSPFDAAPADPPQPADAQPSAVTVLTANELWFDVEVDEQSWLIVADSYFPGWRAWVRKFEAGDDAEQEIPVYLVNGNFRGVLLEPGQWTVRMKYSPDNFKLGAFTSFMVGMILVFTMGVWLWRYAYRESPQDSAVRRVAKNSITPIVLNLFNRGIQFAFAIIMLRILGPEGSGKYYYAVVIFGWFDIVSNFGLDTLLMREVSRSREDANRYLVNTNMIRLALATLGVPVLIGLILARQHLPSSTPLAQDTVWAIGLLYTGLFVSTLNKGLTGLFYAYEKAEYPAALQTVSTMLSASLGVIVLLLNWGIVGLAGISIVVNVVTLVALYMLTTRLFFMPKVAVDWPLLRSAMGESFPLMLNHLLATLFFRIDVTLLEAMKGAVVVGWYSVTYKWVDALNVIPAFFTQALFPVMSRQAQEDRRALRRSYILSVKLLTLVALPVAVVTTLLGTFLVGLLGGPEFLPHGAIALQIFVWSIPIGWINSVTNYVIIALDRQRILTWTFVGGVVFNVTANLIFIPIYSYPAAAVVTIFSELVLLLLFYLVMRPALGSVPWFRMLWRIALATTLMASATWALARTNIVLALFGGIAVYTVAIAVLRPFIPREVESLAQLLPTPVRSPVMKMLGVTSTVGAD